MLILLALLAAAPDARFVEVGGRKVKVQTLGSGAPAVVLTSGFGDSARVWRRLMPQVAAFTRAFAWDRPGLGESDPAPEPRTMTAIAKDLHAALAAAGVAPP